MARDGSRRTLLQFARLSSLRPGLASLRQGPSARFRDCYACSCLHTARTAQVDMQRLPQGDEVCVYSGGRLLSTREAMRVKRGLCQTLPPSPFCTVD